MSETGYAIELYFDPSLENQILKSWNVFARRQISTKLINTESRPHITLFSTSSFLDTTKLEPFLKTLASKLEPLSLTFSSIGTFSNESNTLFLTPTPSVGLLQLQGMVCDGVKKEGVEVGEEWRGDCWVPYCEVGVDVHKSRICEGVGVLREMKLPVCGYAMDVGVVEFSPVVREVFSFGFGSNGLEG